MIYHLNIYSLQQQLQQPPPPEPEPEPEVYEPPPPPEPETFVVVLDDGSEAEYKEYELEDGTVERDNERQKNFDLWCRIN